MKIKEIDARCPICKEWWLIPASELGTKGKCGNCQQTVILIPRSSRAKFWRNAVAVVITLVFLWVAWGIWQSRVDQAVKIQAGTELPDLPPR